jgi:polar amino acid transport system substrate-binding protein
VKLKQITAAFLAAASLFGAGCAEESASGTASDPMADGKLTYDDYNGKRFSIMIGSLFDGVADEYFNPKEKLYFNNVVEEIEAVRLGKTDAALLDSAVAAQSLESGAYPDLTAVEVTIDGLDLPYGVFSTKRDIIDKYNEFLALMDSDGTLKEMQDRWLTTYSLETKMPEITMPENPSGTLNVAIMATYAPFVFLGDNGEFSGFDIEQMKRFAAYLGMDVKFTDMDFGALLPYIAAGKADIGGSVYATDERKQTFIFGDPDFVSKTVVVVKKP